MNPYKTTNRAEINRQNAAHSTGPVSQEGRRRVSLNALRHGLTGHTVVLPSEELAANPQAKRNPKCPPILSSIVPSPKPKLSSKHSDLLTRLSLYEHRLNRTVEKAKAELKQLQKERVEAREKALIKAGEIAKFKEALHQPWEPRDDGFEFSREDVTAWLRRIELNDAVLSFRIDGCLPAPPAGPDKKSNGKALL